MKLFDVYPVSDVAITKALGSRVWDDEGNEYLDFYGGHAVISIGHTNAHWVKRISGQMAEISFYSNSVVIPIQQQLADMLGRVSGKNDYQLFLCNSGAEANENAMKLASFHNGKKKVIAFKGAFHGRTSLAVAATDNPSIVAPVNDTENIIRLPLNDINALENAFKENEISAVIVEGIQGVGGIVPASKEFLQAIRRLCDEHSAVYIADSVQCGYGRSGKFFSHDYAGVQADIYSMAKGMGNGFPVAGILISPGIAPKHYMLGTTFGGNQLACAAALAVLEEMDSKSLMNNASEIGEYLISELKKIEGILEVRGRGLMIGIQLDASRADVRNKLLSEYRIFTGSANPNVIRLLPALNITKDDAGHFLDSFKKAMLA